MPSPLLDQYNQDGVVTPALQRALDMTRQKLFPAGMLPSAGAAPPVTPNQPPQSAPLVSPQPVSRETAPSAPAPLVSPQQPAAPSPMPMSRPSANQQELTRLTAPPLQGSSAHTKADTGQSGIGQIKHAAARIPLQILDAIGSTFAPALTMGLPGTQLHHQMLVGQAARGVGREQEAAKSAADVAHVGAETTESEARAVKERAQGEAALKDKPDKAEAKTIETADGIMQWNPETSRYDIPAGQAPGKNATQHVVSSDGSVIAIHTDAKTGKTTHEIIYRGDPKVETDLTDLEINGKPHKALVNKKTGELIKDLGTSGIKPSTNDHGVTMIGPDGKVLRLQPGQTAPTGVQTPSGVSSTNTPTTQMRNVAAQAGLVHEQTPHMLSEIDRLAGKLGPVAGRWNEFMQGHVGTDDPDMAGLRADLMMYSSAVALMHARGRLPENLRAEFDHAINAPKQTPANLKAVISRIDDWTSKNMHAMGGKETPGGTPTVTTKEQYDALPKGAEYMEDGKKYRKP